MQILMSWLILSLSHGQDLRPASYHPQRSGGALSRSCSCYVSFLFLQEWAFDLFLLSLINLTLSSYHPSLEKLIRKHSCAHWHTFEKPVSLASHLEGIHLSLLP